MMDDYTLVVGVDAKHLRQLSWTWPTWVRHKPSTVLERPMIVFYNFLGPHSVLERDVRAVVDHPNMTAVIWPPVGIEHERQGDGRFGDPQRYRMLSGFVHVPAVHVKTPYWLKLDTDCIATGMDDWVDPRWWFACYKIVAHPWAFSKPADSMLMLDAWVEGNKDKLHPLSDQPPLNLAPLPGSDRVGHKRIISRCGFFDTCFTQLCSH